MKKALFLSLALALLITACIPSIEVVEPEPEATSSARLPAGELVQLTPLSSQPTSAAARPESQPPDVEGPLSRDQKVYLAHATVRIWGVKRSGGQMRPIYHGSGTIISPDGMILTNTHVADPLSMGYPSDYKPDALLIELVINEDKPPVPSYYATILASDPTLDLAVLRIDTTLDGKPVNPASLNLPYVIVGDSDTVRFGDPIYIFGFPSIGGDTITYSAGGVAGFDSEAPIGNRAWIKTDATIAGGNSGGLASNDRGEIIGVPSQVGTGSATEVSDCRRIQDTNGDGVINSRDSCIPTGGFINGIRPVNWAKPLIEAALARRAYISPYTGGSGSLPAGGSAAMVLNGWAVDTDSDGCLIPPAVTVFPTGAKRISASFRYTGMTAGKALDYTWKLNGRETASNRFTWQLGSSGSCYGFYLENGGDALPDGAYTVEIYSSGQMLVQAQTRVGGAQGESVTLRGRVTDAYSGQGLQGIFVVVLKPGVNVSTWLRNPQDADVFTFTTSDANGDFQMPDGLERGKTYGIAAGNNSMGYPAVSGEIEVKSDSSAVLELPIQLSK